MGGRNPGPVLRAGEAAALRHAESLRPEASRGGESGGTLCLNILIQRVPQTMNDQLAGAARQRRVACVVCSAAQVPIRRAEEAELVPKYRAAVSPLARH